MFASLALFVAASFVLSAVAVYPMYCALDAALLAVSRRAARPLGRFAFRVARASYAYARGIEA